MGAKGEISWKRRGEYGERMEYYARNERGVWKFFQRERRFEKWESYAEPEFDDWLELLDGVRRRIPRRKMEPADEQRLVRTIKEKFPVWTIGPNRLPWMI